MEEARGVERRTVVYAAAAGGERKRGDRGRWINENGSANDRTKVRKRGDTYTTGVHSIAIFSNTYVDLAREPKAR